MNFLQLGCNTMSWSITQSQSVDVEWNFIVIRYSLICYDLDGSSHPHEIKSGIRRDLSIVLLILTENGSFTLRGKIV